MHLNATYATQKHHTKSSSIVSTRCDIIQTAGNARRGGLCMASMRVLVGCRRALAFPACLLLLQGGKGILNAAFAHLCTPEEEALCPGPCPGVTQLKAHVGDVLQLFVQILTIGPLKRLVVFLTTDMVFAASSYVLILEGQRFGRNRNPGMQLQPYPGHLPTLPLMNTSLSALYRHACLLKGQHKPHGPWVYQQHLKVQFPVRCLLQRLAGQER